MCVLVCMCMRMGVVDRVGVGGGFNFQYLLFFGVYVYVCVGRSELKQRGRKERDTAQLLESDKHKKQLSFSLFLKEEAIKPITLLSIPAPEYQVLGGGEVEAFDQFI